jgi:hypothetical protein
MKASLTWLRRFVGPLIKAINRKNEAGLGSGQSWVDVRWLLSGGEQEAYRRHGLQSRHGATVGRAELMLPWYRLAAQNLSAQLNICYH